MRNQPKYTFFKNTHYALEGLKEVFKNETSFKIELSLIILLSLFVWIIDLDFVLKAILQTSLFLPLLIEVINSAIERVVDLVTIEHHELAKRAKDAGSAAVFISILMTVFIWLMVFIYAFYL